MNVSMLPPHLYVCRIMTVYASPACQILFMKAQTFFSYKCDKFVYPYKKGGEYDV